MKQKILSQFMTKNGLARSIEIAKLEKNNLRNIIQVEINKALLSDEFSSEDIEEINQEDPNFVDEITEELHKEYSEKLDGRLVRLNNLIKEFA
jgi:hypothetical protein